MKKGDPMASVGYVRVSTTDQNLDRQYALMEKYNVDKIFEDKASGKNLDRKGLDAALSYLRSGDTLYIESFSRLSRTTVELLQITERLEKMGVRLVSVKEMLDTHSPTGKLQLTMIAAVYQFEREIMLERQAEGITCAKQKGAYKGRKPKELTPELKLAMKGWSDGTLSAKDAVRISGVQRATFYKKCHEYGYAKEKEI